MIKFEYKFLRATGGIKIKIGKSNDDTISPKDVPKTLNALGAEGWELVGFDSHSLGEITVYVLKRQIA